MWGPFLLGDWDDAPDVCGMDDDLGGWYVAGVPIDEDDVRQQLRLQRYDAIGTLLSYSDVWTGQDQGGVNARLARVDGGAWLSYRAVVDEVMQVCLRRVTGIAVGAPEILGRADGPHVINGDWLAWQDIPAGKVFGRPLNTTSKATVVLRHETRPTGLSRMDGAWPVFADEDRESVPGMYNPVRTNGLVVGEHPAGGIATRCHGGQVGRLLPGEITGGPRPAWGKVLDTFAVVCWGGPGARLIIFMGSEVVPAVTT